MTYRLDIPIYCKYLSRKFAHFILYMECPRFPSKDRIIRNLTKKLDISHFGLVKEEILDAVESIKLCDWPDDLKKNRKHHSCDVVRKEFGRQKLTIEQILVFCFWDENSGIYLSAPKGKQ